MTSPGDAAVVPIALVLNGRTGHTVWAAPWVEDGEEWQAFLGAGNKVFVFEDLEDLAGFLGSGADNDLSDHPSWTMLQTLPAEQLEPEPDYVFDLDEVPALLEREPDDDVVTRIGDAIDMVQRIAECCDDGALLNLCDSPEFAALLDEETEFDVDTDDGASDAGASDAEDRDRDGAEDTGDDADAEDADEDDVWAEIGEAVRTTWPLVIDRVDGCLRWFAAGERPAGAVSEPSGDAGSDAEPEGAAPDSGPGAVSDAVEAVDGSDGEQTDTVTDDTAARARR